MKPWRSPFPPSRRPTFLFWRPAGIAPYRGALAGVAIALLRTEGIAWALLIALLGIVTRRMKGEAVWRPVAIYVAIVGTAFSVYFAWRYSYYQLLFPNPVYAKVGFSPEVALRGFRYVATFALAFVTPLLLLPAASYVAWREAPKPVALALGTLSLAFPAYAVVVGGDWMAMGRFLVPGFAFGALLMGWLAARLWEHLSSIETATVPRLVKLFVFVVLVGSHNLGRSASRLERTSHTRVSTPCLSFSLHKCLQDRVRVLEYGSRGPPPLEGDRGDAQAALRTGRQHCSCSDRRARVLFRPTHLRPLRPSRPPRRDA